MPVPGSSGSFIAVKWGRMFFSLWYAVMMQKVTKTFLWGGDQQSTIRPGLCGMSYGWVSGCGCNWHIGHSSTYCSASVCACPVWWVWPSKVGAASQDSCGLVKAEWMFSRCPSQGLLLTFAFSPMGSVKLPYSAVTLKISRISSGCSDAHGICLCCSPSLRDQYLWPQHIPTSLGITMRPVDNLGIVINLLLLETAGETVHILHFLCCLLGVWGRGSIFHSTSFLLDGNESTASCMLSLARLLCGCAPLSHLSASPPGVAAKPQWCYYSAQAPSVTAQAPSSCP